MIGKNVSNGWKKGGRAGGARRGRGAEGLEGGVFPMRRRGDAESLEGGGGEAQKGTKGMERGKGGGKSSEGKTGEFGRVFRNLLQGAEGRASQGWYAPGA